MCTSGSTGQRTADDDKARERGVDGRRLKTARGVAPAALLQGSARWSFSMRMHVQDRNPVLAHSLRRGHLPAKLLCRGAYCASPIAAQQRTRDVRSCCLGLSGKRACSRFGSVVLPSARGTLNVMLPGVVVGAGVVVGIGVVVSAGVVVSTGTVVAAGRAQHGQPY